MGENEENMSEKSRKLGRKPRENRKSNQKSYKKRADFSALFVFRGGQGAGVPLGLF